MEIALDAPEMAVVNEVALTVSELPATYDFGAAEGALITEVASSTWEVIVFGVTAIFIALYNGGGGVRFGRCKCCDWRCVRSFGGNNAHFAPIFITISNSRSCAWFRRRDF